MRKLSDPKSKDKNEKPSANISGSEAARKNPRMQRLASQLAMIHISLDPPSPPPPPDEEDEELIYSTPHDNDFKISPPSFSWTRHYTRFIDASQLLQVPRGDFGEAYAGGSDGIQPPRQCSPPPRRCSYASTTSENSSTSPNASYQNLLSPFGCTPLYCGTRRSPILELSGSQSLGSDDCETPPLGGASFNTIIDFVGNNRRKKLSESGTSLLGYDIDRFASDRRPSMCFRYQRGRSVGATDFLTRPLSALVVF